MKKIFTLIAAFFLIVTISKAQPLTADFIITSPQCEGTTVTFQDASTGGTGTIIEWDWYVNGVLITFPLDPTFSYLFPVGTTTAVIKLRVDDGNNIAFKDSTITIYPTPTITITPSASSVCPGSPSVLTPSGGASYLWTGGSTANPYTVNPSSPTTYSVTATDVHGCINTASTTINIYPTYTTPQTATICPGDSIFLEGAWRKTAGSYSDVLNTIHGCDSTIVTTLSLYTAPTVNISPSATGVCPGTSVTLTPSGGVSYLWTGGSTANPLITTLSGTTTYWVTATDNHGCTGTASTTITLYPTYTTPVALAICDGDSVLLEGAWQKTAGVYTDVLATIHGCDSTVITTLTVNPLPDVTVFVYPSVICEGESSTFTASGANTYEWNTGATTNEIVVNPTTPTTYTVTGTLNTTGCSASINAFVTVHPTYTVPQTATICQGDSILLGGMYQYTAGVYEDVLTTVHGCDSTIQTTLTVNPLPVKYTLTGSGTYPNAGAGRPVYLSDSQIGVSYSLYRGTSLMTNEIGTSNSINFGNQFSGTYHCFGEVDATGCSVMMNDYVVIVEGTSAGASKIAANVRYGNDTLTLLFVPAAVEVTLYKQSITMSLDTVITVIQTLPLPATALVEFNNLVPGDYYLKSEVIDTASYPGVTPTCFYEDGFIVDSAVMITVDPDEVFIADIKHYFLPSFSGSNNAGGEVSYDGGSKALTPAPDQVVILRDDAAGDILAVDVTDVDGLYDFSDIPDYGQYSIYLTSFQYQMWTPATFTTTTSGTFVFDFVIDTVAGSAVITSAPSVSVPTGNEIVIYPNPAQDYVIVLTQSTSTVRITNIVGQILFEERGIHGKKIDITSFTSGVYLVEFLPENATTWITKKLIINKE